MGCDVRQRTRVIRADVHEDSVTGLVLETGQTITARHYLDASGHAGILRRPLGIAAPPSTNLQNIAIWDYFQNADWAVEIGVGGTRVQVISLGYGWIWFIPLGPTRTSVGLIVPKDYYRDAGLSTKALFARALGEDSRIASLLKNATSEGNLQSTKDWSFLAERHVGQNWFLIGESAGFADPILAAGMTLAHVGAKEAAYTILALEAGDHDPEWLRSAFDTRQRKRIGNHIMFADYWYTANAQFTDLKDYTQKIAAANGYSMSPEQSWAWLAQGGFIGEQLRVGHGGYPLSAVKDAHALMTGGTVESSVAKNNVFQLDLSGASWQDKPLYGEGKITKMPCFVRGEKALPLAGVMQATLDILQLSSKLPDILQMIAKLAQHSQEDPDFMQNVVQMIPVALEGMIADGWVHASFDPDLPLVSPPPMATGIYWNNDPVQA
jgi:hypothetical protein